jgi:hypothetical protein
LQHKELGGSIYNQASSNVWQCTFIVHLFLLARRAMPKIAGPFWVWERPKTKKFQITLYPASGLPPEVCRQWQRRGFSKFPLELAVFRNPKTEPSAKTGAVALINYLKSQLNAPGGKPQDVPRENDMGIDANAPAVGEWLGRFVSKAKRRACSGVH